MNDDIDTTEPATNNDGYTPTKPQPIPIPEQMRREMADYDLDLDTPPGTILDIGACLGAWTLHCAKRWPDARIIAYEPSRDNAAAWRAHCGDVRCAELHEAAVRRVNGQDLISKVNGYPGEGGFHNLTGNSQPDRFVDCISAAELPEADLVKIDTEGCEVEILENLRTEKTTAIVCEWHRTDDKPKLIMLANQRGFELFSTNHYDGDRRGVIKFIRPGAVKKRKTKLFVGVPVYQQAASQFMQCMFALQADRPCELHVSIGQGDGVMRTRNVFTQQFLNSDCTHFLQIDCDLIFSPQHVERIISHDVDVVGGFYPKKQEGPLEWVINTFPGPVEKRADGLHKVSYIGTGFLCIKRNAIEKMVQAYPYSAFCADFGTREVIHELWPMGVYCAECKGEAGPGCSHSPFSRRYLSEDWYFCQRWMDLGGSVYGDTRVVLKHIGPAIFPLITQQPEIENPKVPESPDKPSSDSAMAVGQSVLTNEQV